MSCRSHRAYITYTSSSQHIAITSRRNFSFPSFKLRLNTKTKLRSCLIKKIFKLRSCKGGKIDIENLKMSNFPWVAGHPSPPPHPRANHNVRILLLAKNELFGSFIHNYMKKQNITTEIHRIGCSACRLQVKFKA